MNRVEIQKRDLMPALQSVIGSVGKGNMLPILQNINCSIKDCHFNLTTTDLEIQSTTDAPCSPIDGDIDFTISAESLNKITSQLPEGEILFIIDGEKATIKSGRSRFSLKTLPPQDYPALGLDIKPLVTFNIESGDLLKALKHTAFAVAKNDARYYLNGMLFDLSPNFSGLGSSKRVKDDKQRLRLVATDGHRMAVSDIPVECAGEYQIVVPRRAVLELVKLLDNSSDTVKVELSTDFVRFTLPKVTLSTKTINGKFPEYQRVVPKNSDKTALIDRNELRQALQRASILSHERYKGIKLLFEPRSGEGQGTLTLEATNEEQETATDVLDVDFTDTEGQIAFNIQYVLDLISAIDCSSVCIEFTDGISSALFRDPDNQDEVFVVMPMRL